MAQVQISLHQNNTVEDDGQYQVENVVEATTGISLALFVFSRYDDTFNRVASVRDLETYPESKAETLEQDLSYYRGSVATLKFDAVDDAVAFARVVRSSLEYLAADYRRYKDSFEGSGDYTFTSED